MDKAAKPLKIFISYGHEIGAVDESGKPYPDPNNESIVRKIKACLESRGHEVWLDRERIKEGDDWRRSIYEGVEWSDVALICLSRKAMKPNGVCRDEISIALGVRGGNIFPVKLEALKDSEYPAYLLTRQLFTEFMDWRSHWTEDSIDEVWLDQNLETLANSLEAENVWRYGVEMVELKKLLKPLNMNDRLRRLDRGIQTLYNEETQEFENRIVHKFCGRESLFQLFEGRIGQSVRRESERILWLKKGPGFGKSRFAAELLYRYYYLISAAYFIEYNQRETLDPHTFVKSVAYQLAQANSSYREKLLNYLKENQGEINLQTDDPQTLFKKLVVDLMSDEIDGGRATQWILVDALDEATENNRNEIASLISQNLDRLPSWFCFFITSRDRDNAVNRNFAQFLPVNFPEEENDSDVRDYILNEFKGMNITVSEELVNILQEKSAGTFLYPEMVFRDLEKSSFTLDDIRDLPKGVIGYIHKQFDRLFGKDLELYENDVRPMLGFILTSCEPISRAVLKYCLGISRDSELEKRLKWLGTFFIQSGLTDEDTVVPFHKSVIDYCFNKECSEDYYVYPDEAKEDFAHRGLDLYKSGALQWTTRNDEKPDIVQLYFLTWLPSHLMNADMTKETAAVLSDFAFLMKRLRFGNVERVLLDYILFRNALKGVSFDCDAYFDVICRNMHFMRRNCEDNPAYKIMLQIATEAADECPITQAAERWLNPKEGDSPCDWFWLNKVKRPKEYQPNPCKLVIEGLDSYVLLLSNNNVLSWGQYNNLLRIWNLETGKSIAVLEGHTKGICGVIELRTGDILSWSDDKTLRLWSSDGICKAVLEGHTEAISGGIELRSGDILSWSADKTMRLWSPEGACKSVMQGHTGEIRSVRELRSGDILTWCNWQDKSIRIWSPNGECKAVLNGHRLEISDALELRSGDILTWCGHRNGDSTLRLWSPDGICKAVFQGHTYPVKNAIELRSGDILSWSENSSLRLWSPDGICKAVLEGHTYPVRNAIELRSGDILSWSENNNLRLWSPDGVLKAVLEGHKGQIQDVFELRSGDILLWSEDSSLHLWSSEGILKAVLEGDKGLIRGALELRSGDILSWDYKTLRLWTPDGACKAVLDGHTGSILEVMELCSGNILSYSNDKTLRLWTPDGNCQAVLDGHSGNVLGMLELGAGDILSWSDDRTLRIWSPNVKNKAALKGHIGIVKNAIKLRSGDVLTWCGGSHDYYDYYNHFLRYNNYFSRDNNNPNIDSTLRLWSPDGECKAVLEKYFGLILGAIELNSGDILSWKKFSLGDYWHNYNIGTISLYLWSSEGTFKTELPIHEDDVILSVLKLSSGNLLLTWGNDHDLSLLAPDGEYKASLKGHTEWINGAIELHSGDILSWSWDQTLRLWSPDGICKAVLEGHKFSVDGAIELRSGNILSWSIDRTMRLWTPDGECKVVLEGHTSLVKGAVDLNSGDIVSWSLDDTIRLWSSDGTCKEVIDTNNPQYDSYYSLFIPEQVFEQFYAKETRWGIELQHDFKPIARWNSPFCKSQFIASDRICVWYGRFVEFLQLNYGNHKSVSFEQAHQFLAGEIDESQLVTYVPESKGTAIPKTE